MRGTFHASGASGASVGEEVDDDGSGRGVHEEAQGHHLSARGRQETSVCARGAVQGHAALLCGALGRAGEEQFYAMLRACERILMIGK